MCILDWRSGLSYLKQVWEYRYFWFSLARSDLQRRYRRSTLGLGWSLLQPLAMAAVLCIVYQHLFKMDLKEFALLLLTGLAFWNFFAGMVLQGCTCFIAAEPYIRQQPAPLAIYPLRTILTLGFHFLVALSLPVVLGTVILGRFSPLAILSLLPTLLLLFLLGWSTALLAGFAHVYFSDTQHLSEVGLQALMFLTPVLYPPHILESNGMGWIVRYNPLATFLDLVRTPLMTGQFPALESYLFAAVFVGVTSLVAVFITSRLERELIFAM